MLDYSLVDRYHDCVRVRVCIVYYGKDPLNRSICARQTHGRQIINRFLCGISLLLHISTHHSSAGFHQHSTVRPSLLRNADCVCPHTLLKSYSGFFTRSMCFLVNDQAIIRPRWLCNHGQIRCPAVAAIIRSRTTMKEQMCGRNCSVCDTAVYGICLDVCTWTSLTCIAIPEIKHQY